MGDAISILPMVDCLSGSFGEVGLIAQKPWQPIFSGKPNLHFFGSRIPWASYKSKEKYRSSSYLEPSFLSFLKGLSRFAGGAVGFDPRGDVRSVAFLYLAGCREVYTLSHYLGTDSKVPKLAARVLDTSRSCPRWELACSLAGFALGKCGGRAPAITGAASKRASRTVGFLTVAPWKGKLWNRENWLKLKHLLEVSGQDVRFLCGPGQEKEIQSEFPGAVVVQCNSIEEWIRALGELEFFITVDSGPMHLADAMGVPLIALFGSGSLPLWAPNGKFSRVIHHQDDPEFEPVHQVDGCEHLGTKWMDRITVDQVWECYRNMLPELGQPGAKTGWVNNAL